MKVLAILLCAGLSGYACIGYAQEHNLSATQHEQLYTMAEPDHGNRQSTINIVSSDSRHAAIHKIAFNYHPSTKTVLNLGHTIPGKYDAGNNLRSAGRVYEFRQIHFH